MPTSNETASIDSIALDQIDSDDRFRLREELLPKLEALAESIRAHGQTTPLFVITKEHGRFALISGYRRKAALESIGEKMALVRIFKGLSESEALDLAISENAQRDDLNDWEKALACARLLRDGKKIERIAEQFGFGERQAYRYLTVSKVEHESLKNALRTGAIPMSHAVAIAERILSENSPLSSEMIDSIILETIESKTALRALETKLNALCRPKEKTNAKSATTQVNISKAGTFSLRLSYKPNLHDYNDALKTLEEAKLEIKRIKKEHEEKQRQATSEDIRAKKARIEEKKRALIEAAHEDIRAQKARIEERKRALIEAAERQAETELARLKS